MNEKVKTESKLKSIKECAYELYKANWMLDKKITLEDIINYISLAGIRDYDELEEVGLCDGSIWVCFDEFLDNEYLCEEYMRSILPGSMLIEYLADMQVDKTKDLINNPSSDSAVSPSLRNSELATSGGVIFTIDEFSGLGINISLTPAQVSQITDEIRILPLICDAERQVEDFFDFNDEFDREDFPFGSDDYRYMANKFVSIHECNIDDNSQWSELIRNYIAECYESEYSKGCLKAAL